VYHPDKNKDVDVDRFKLISESYSILSDEKLRSEYDLKSKWGRRYDERSELFDFEFSNTSRGWDEDKFTESKKNDSLNVIRYVDDTFDGNIEYERWVICKICKGSGKDLKSKIEILNILNQKMDVIFVKGVGKMIGETNVIFVSVKEK
jgi:DnaJ-class molecular chaperone